MPKTSKKCPYTGQEPSPKGRGFCARNMPLNIVMFGTDGHLWIVKKVSNGVKRWVRCKTTKQKSTRNRSKRSPPTKKSKSTKKKPRSSLKRKNKYSRK